MSGIFGPVGNVWPLTSASPPPALYTDLLAHFGGDVAELAKFVAATEALDPDSALSLLLFPPVSVSDAFGAELSAPDYLLSVAIVPGSIYADAIELPSTF